MINYSIYYYSLNVYFLLLFQLLNYLISLESNSILRVLTFFYLFDLIKHGLCSSDISLIDVNELVLKIMMQVKSISYRNVVAVMSYSFSAVDSFSGRWQEVIKNSYLAKHSCK